MPSPRAISGARASGVAAPSGVAPLVTVAWEITRSCPLRCLHCRADAQVRRDPRELTLAEGQKLIGEAAAAGARVLVVTGGDPFARADLFDIVRSVTEHGMHAGLSPSATPRLTPAALDRAAKAGTGTVHLSLDGASEATHDSFRGVRGSFRRTLAAFELVRDRGMRLQVGTTVCRRTLPELQAIAEMLEGRVDAWTLFFLVPTGRAPALEALGAPEQSRVLHWLAGLRASFAVRSVEAPELRRVLADGRGAGHPPGGAGPLPSGVGVGDGRGFCFVSHVGDVCPSGFLQVPVGNVRERSLGYWYERAPLMRALREQARYGGRCGICEWWSLCGGSRARAWAVSGDPLAEDPACDYFPAASAPSASPEVPVPSG